jgi:hypothetical protein
MTESVEEIVARWEARPVPDSNPDWTYLRRTELQAIVTSWRERGERLSRCEAVARRREPLRGDSDYSMGASDMAREIADEIAAI